MPGARSPRAGSYAALKLAAGVLLFVLAFRDVSPAAVWAGLQQVDLAWLGLALMSVLATVLGVTMRWKVLLGASGLRQIQVLFAAVVASQVANIVMPLKLGDAVRIGAVGRLLRRQPATVLGSVAVERLFDILMAAATAGLLVAAGTLPGFARPGMLSVALGLGGVLVIVGLAIAGPLDLAARRLAALFPNRIGAWSLGQLNLLVEGFRRVANAAVMLEALAWSVAVLTGSVLTAWLLQRACGLHVPAISAATVVIVLQVGGAVLPVPGAVGVSQVLTVETLRVWGVAETPALTYALMLYFVSRVPKLAVLPFSTSVLFRGTPAVR